MQDEMFLFFFAARAASAADTRGVGVGSDLTVRHMKGVYGGGRSSHLPHPAPPPTSYFPFLLKWGTGKNEYNQDYTAPNHPHTNMHIATCTPKEGVNAFARSRSTNKHTPPAAAMRASRPPEVFSNMQKCRYPHFLKAQRNDCNVHRSAWFAAKVKVGGGGSGRAFGQTLRSGRIDDCKKNERKKMNKTRREEIRNGLPWAIRSH